MTGTTDLAAIARGLSVRERELIVHGLVIGAKNPRGAITRLCDLGLGDCTIKGDDEAENWFFRVSTPLGLALRHHLQELDNAPD